MDGNADMNLSTHPLWLVGFRPFFALACFSGLALGVWHICAQAGGTANVLHLQRRSGSITLFIMKRLFRTLPWSHMKKSILRFGVLFSLFAGFMQLSCKNDDRQELFELNFPPPPIEFDILPGLNTFDTHIYSFSPIPTRYLEKLAASGHSADEVIAIEAKDATSNRSKPQLGRHIVLRS